MLFVALAIFSGTVKLILPDGIDGVFENKRAELIEANERARIELGAV